MADYYDSLLTQGGYAQDDKEMSLISETDAQKDTGRQVMRDIANATGLVMSQRNDSAPSFKYFHGDQWEELDRMRMQQLKRPALVLNDIQPTIDAVSGLERLNRMGVRFVTRALDSSTEEDMAGDLASEARDASLDLCGGEQERSRAIKDMAIGGMGWVEVRTSFDEDADGRVILEYLPWDEMFWDPHARKENLEDASWRARVRTISRKHFKKLYGQENLNRVDASAPGDWEERKVGKYELVTPYYSRANELANPGVSQFANAAQQDNVLPVIQHQRRDFEPVYRFLDPSNPDQLTTMDEDSWKRLKQKYELLGMPVPDAVQQLKPVFKQVVVCRGVVLEEDVTLPGNNFSLLCITGKWDANKKVWYGIVRPMKDPQDMKNKSVSSGLTFYISNAKGGVMFKTSAFVDPNYAKEQWAKPDAWIEVNDQTDITGDIIQRSPSPMPGEIGQFIQIADSAMRSTSGITEEMIGIAQGQTPSPTAASRVRGGLAVLGWFFDAISRHMRTEARVTLEFIREFWTRGQLMQVGGHQHSQQIPLLRSSLPMDYELVVDESVKQNPNLKAQVWADLQPIIPALLRFGFGRFLLQALKYSPLPAQLVAEIQREAAQTPPMQKPQKGGKQEPPEMTAAKVQKLGADTQRALAQARALDKEGNLKMAELTMDAVLGAQDQAHKHAIEKKKETMQQMVQTARTLIGGGEPQP